MEPFPDRNARADAFSYEMCIRDSYQAGDERIYCHFNVSGGVSLRCMSCRIVGKTHSGKFGCYVLDCGCIPLLYFGDHALKLLNLSSFSGFIGKANP